MKNEIDMVLINKEQVIKKKYEVIKQNGVITFNLGKFTLGANVEDLRKFL